LLRNIDSVEELEILLWLRKTGEHASVGTLAEELRSSIGSVSSRLAELSKRGLVAPGLLPDTYKYAPTQPGSGSAITLLAECYRNVPFKIMELIYAKPVDKIEIFAEAFRLEKKERDPPKE
jgi:hypothetical protein